MSLKDILGLLAGLLLMIFGIGLKTKMDSLKKAAETAEKKAEAAEKQTVAVKMEAEKREAEGNVYHVAVEASKTVSLDPEVKVQMERIRNQEPMPVKIVPMDSKPEDSLKQEGTEDVFQGLLASAAEKLNRDVAADAGTSDYMQNRIADRRNLYEERYGKES